MRPKTIVIIQIGLFIAFFAGIIVFLWLLFNKPWHIANCVLLFLSFMVCLAMIGEHRPRRRDTKGLVSILSHSIKDVLPSRLEDQDYIFFAKHSDDDGNELSYETREPIIDDNSINEIRERKIVPYYQELKRRIDESIDKKEIKKDIFYINGQHICDFLLDESYSLPSLKRHILSVKESIQHDGSINFIGDKIGISGYELNDGTLTLHIYLTDHFTFKVFKDIFLEYKDLFQIIIRRLNFASDNERKYLINALKFLFSSTGIDVVIHGKQANGKRGLLLAIRNGGIERRKESKIHVPVNESFSKTDQLENSHEYDLKKCVSRGIEEELGISQDVIESKCEFVFQDFSVVCDEGEIGLACYVDFSHCMPLEQTRLYPGQDKSMEIKNLMVVDLPAFYMNADEYRSWFFQETKNDLFCENWESFTPLLYQRFFLRNQTLSSSAVFIINFIVAVAIFIYTAFLFKINPLVQSAFYDFIFEAVITLIVSVIMSFCKPKWAKQKNKRYRLFKPLIPQWGGDASIVQSTSNSIDKGLFDGMFFGCITDKEDFTCSLDRLELITSPYCKTRREGVKNHTEEPISFYRMKYSDFNKQDKRLVFKEIPILYNPSDDNLRVWMSVSFANNDIHYSFTRDIEPPILSFNTSFSNEQSHSLAKYFSIPESDIKNYRLASLSERLNHKDENSPIFRPLDLFFYQNNYYWILRAIGSSDSTKTVMINSETNIYSDFVNTLKSTKSDSNFILTGKSEHVIKALVFFISHKINRAKISALDIYALQLALIRYSNKQKSLVLAQTEPLRA